MGFHFQIGTPRRKHLEAHGPARVSKVVCVGSRRPNKSTARVDANLWRKRPRLGVTGRPGLDASAHQHAVLRPTLNSDATIVAGFDLQAPGRPQTAFSNLAAARSIGPIII